jgi:uncharacterized membrane protein YoaK (UPF0700 family)
MLRKYSTSRTLNENLKLGSLTALTAGMVNVASVLVFFGFTSNVTGHYAILAAEIARGNVYQIGVVLSWIFLFFFGSFVSNFIVINFNERSSYLAHAMPIVLEIICLMYVGLYGEYFYGETLSETQILLALMLFAMGLQNGLTASISNFALKTTHLTGTTTDLGILFSMFTKAKFRNNPELVGRAKLLLVIMFSYLAGATIAGVAYFRMEFKLFYVVSLLLLVVIAYDFSELRIKSMIAQSHFRQQRKMATEKASKLTNGSGFRSLPDVRAKVGRTENEISIEA